MEQDAPVIVKGRRTNTAAPRREKTKEQILEATYRALVKIGYENLTTRLIAEEAGCNVATLHYHFVTKENLLSEAVGAVLRRDSARIRDAADNAPSGAIALERAIAAVWGIVRERLGIVRYDLIIRGLRDPDARRDAMTVYGAFRQLTESILQRHLNEGGTLPSDCTVTQLAHYTISCVDGVILQYALTQDEAATRASLHLILSSVLALTGGDNNGPKAPIRA